MAAALKDIQFSSPVLNGTAANNKTTWTYGANDVVVFGCGSDGCSYSERHYGCEEHCGCEFHSGYEYHEGSVTFGGCGYEDHYGYEYHHGYVIFDAYSYAYHYGCEEHCGYESHAGSEYHYGSEYHCGHESHCGCEYHYGYESHCGDEIHDGHEYHYGYESHCGWARFSGSCSCATDGFAETNFSVNGIAVVDPTDPSNKVLLTYSVLKSHGF